MSNKCILLKVNPQQKGQRHRPNKARTKPIVPPGKQPALYTHTHRHTATAGHVEFCQALYLHRLHIIVFELRAWKPVIRPTPRQSEVS